MTLGNMRRQGVHSLIGSSQWRVDSGGPLRPAQPD